VPVDTIRGMTNQEITLSPMTGQEFDAWMGSSVKGYAKMQVEAGTWTAQEAPALSAKEFESLLPKGLDTEGHHLYTVQKTDDSASVGILWIQIRPKAGQMQAYIYDIAIHESMRGQGYGRATMLACAQRARELGAQSVGLHVHGHNTVARSLYTSLGFIETDITMSLPLDAVEG
jgi:ribosomal protein S18 acetylase RimI-like enzyme